MIHDQFNIRVFLTVISIDPDPAKKDDSQLLLISREASMEMEFPHEYLNRKSTTKDIAVSMLESYIGVTLEWAMLFPFGVIENVDPEKTTIDILYSVFIPGITRIHKEGLQWVSYKELNDSDGNTFTKKMAHECIWRSI